MKLIVDKAQRLAKMRAHTWAHLLNNELDQILGGTKQSWSFVDEDFFRFDFTTSKPLTAQEISQMETNINNIIYQAIDVSIHETNLDEAIKLWAKAVFEDKYGDKVRVVCVANPWDAKALSIELCWWTHVKNTADIWAFKIIWQEAVASGIRRIIAITGHKVWLWAIEKDSYITEIATKLWCPTNQIIGQIEKMEKENKSFKDEIKKLDEQKIEKALNEIQQNLSNGKIKNNEFYWFIIINVFELYGLSNEIKFNDYKNLFLTKFGTQRSILFFTPSWNFLLLWNNAKNIKESQWLKWWGSPECIIGKDEKVLEMSKK